MRVDEALGLRDYIDRLFVSRKVGVRGLTRFEYSVDAPIRAVEDCIKKEQRIFELEKRITSPATKRTE